jgi:hypothetical protein
MPTFMELQQKLTGLRDRKAILLMLIEHIEKNFRPIAGATPKLFVKTDDGTIVLDVWFDIIAHELNEKVRACDTETGVILGTNLVVQESPAPQPAAPVAAES